MKAETESYKEAITTHRTVLVARFRDKEDGSKAARKKPREMTPKRWDKIIAQFEETLVIPPKVEREIRLPKGWEKKEDLDLLIKLRRLPALNAEIAGLSVKTERAAKDFINYIGGQLAGPNPRHGRGRGYLTQVIAWLRKYLDLHPMDFDYVLQKFIEKSTSSSPPVASVTSCSPQPAASSTTSAFIQLSSQRRLRTSAYRVVASNDFPQYGTFNHRVEVAANGERLWCCDHFPDVKLRQQEQPLQCTAQPTHVTTKHSSSVGDAKHWGGDWTLYAATAVIGAAALLFLKKVFWGTGAKKNANSARNTYLRGQSGNRAHVVPRDAKTNSLDPTFAQYRKNK
eukprot:GHVT01101725.1.p1 GENE.GHVT01101725.1~~GHVT01101725.1.p1  ORF type:complete len:341 (-),score=50.97 GHVT01101725.1:313-1335(-)